MTLRLSRRELQRKFPPGIHLINKQNETLYLVIGWSEIPALTHVIPGTKKLVTTTKSWQIWLLGNQRFKAVRWDGLHDYMTLKEWEYDV